MVVYELAGTALDVDLTIPELASSEGPVGAHPWLVRRAGELPGARLHTIAELRTTHGVLWGTIEAGTGSETGRYRFTYPTHATFEVHVPTRRVAYERGEGASDMTVRHLLIDQVLPYLLVADGMLVLHASCVARDDQAIGFVGPTGAGKSTMAAGFVQEGWALVADDLAVLAEDEGGDGYRVTPVYPGLRLWGDSAEHFAGRAVDLPLVADYTDKRRWAVAAGAAGAVPLAALVALGSRPTAGQPDVRIGRLRGADAFSVACEEGFRLERTGRRRQAAELERFARFVERVPVHLVEYRRDWELLPEVRAAVLAATLG